MLTIWEVIQIIVTIIAVGFIFSPLPFINFEIYDELGNSDKNRKRKIVLKMIGFGAAVAAPAVILHELAHKLLALHFGFSATYFASWWGLSIGIFLKLLSSNFIFFVPGYVSISGIGTPIQFGLVALAGPITNLILFLIFTIFLSLNIAPKYQVIWALSKRINLWLFIFNMLPIPGLDGFKFYTSLLQTFVM
ncbi:MAG: hypothetical protein ACP5IJ_02820 [Candidatus Nanoarchaeia archaeon]